MSKMHVVIGAPATGSNYFPRDSVARKLTLTLAIENVLFLAPRRMGKTSVLLHLENTAPAKTLWLDLERFNHPYQWIKAMIQALQHIEDHQFQQLLTKADDFLGRLSSEVLTLNPQTWQEKGDALLHGLSKLQQPVWFLLDEFPIMIDLIAKQHGIAEAEAALHWLRGLRQQNHQSPVRFLLTGSIGLDNVLRKHGLRGVANDFRREPLPPISESEALELALTLAKDNEVPLNQALANEYIQRLGPAIYPYFIQLFIAELQDRAANRQKPVDLESVYQAVAYGQRNQYADNMWHRLGDFFNDTQTRAARLLLKQTAASASGLPPEQVRQLLPDVLDDDLHHLLAVLQHDGYLCEADNGNLVFFSHLLRDYWHHKNRL